MGRENAGRESPVLPFIGESHGSREQLEGEDLEHNQNQRPVSDLCSDTWGGETVEQTTNINRVILLFSKGLVKLDM